MYECPNCKMRFERGLERRNPDSGFIDCPRCKTTIASWDRIEPFDPHVQVKQLSEASVG